MTTEEHLADLGILGLTGAVLLGRGGFGTVYQVEEPALHRSVAVKVLHPLQEDEPARLDRELRALGMLGGHPHIVMVHGTGLTAHGASYIVMELMTGGSLGDRLARRGPVPWTEVTAMAVQIAGALETAHRAGILHRDLKPENILVSSFGEVKLADFGIARVHGAERTKSGNITTSLAYGAPEVLAGQEPSAQSDVYGLAAALFTLLAGATPFVRPTDESLMAIMGRIASEPAPDLRPSGVPDVVCAVLERALAKDVGSRHSTALEFARDMQAAQVSVGLPVTPVLVEGEPDVVRSTPAVSVPTGPPPGATVVVSMQPGAGGPPAGVFPPVGGVAPAAAGPPAGVFPPVGGPPAAAGPPAGPPPGVFPPVGGVAPAAAGPPAGPPPGVFPPAAAGPPAAGPPAGVFPPQQSGFPPVGGAPGFPPAMGLPVQAPKKAGVNRTVLISGAVVVVALVVLVGVLLARGGDDNATSPVARPAVTTTPASSGGRAFPGNRILTDRTERITVEVPDTWNFDGSSGFDAGATIPRLVASPDVRAALDSFRVPGVFVAVRDGEGFADQARLRNDLAPENCERTFRDFARWEGNFLFGEIDNYVNCGGSRNQVFLAVLTDPPVRTVVIAVVQSPDVNEAIRLVTTMQRSLRVR